MGFSPANLLFFLWAMTATVSGVVVDEAGRPVADAEVRLSSSLAARTSQEGGFRIERVQTGGIQELVATRPGFAPSLRTISVPELGSVPPLRITLRRGRTVFGAVEDEEGQPAAGVKVELARSQAVSQNILSVTAPPDRGLHQTTTDSEGRFTLLDLPAGHFDLAALGPGFRSPLAQAVQVVPGTEPLDLGTFTLETRALEGRVRDPEGRPVAGAEVWLLPENGFWEWWGIDFGSERPAAVTGAEGHFEIPDLPSRGWGSLLVCREGFLQAFAAAAPAGETVEVVLVPPIPISGKVLDLQGEPLAGASVSVRLSGRRGSDLTFPEGPCASGSPRTDAEGRFSLELMEPGWYDIHAEAAEFLLGVRERVRVPSEEEIVLTLEAGATVEGRVRDPEGGPIPGARIAIYDGRSLSSVSLADGTYRLEGVVPGSRSLYAEHPDYSGESRDIEVPAEGKRIDLVLHPRARHEIRGRVLGPEGEPVEGALVSTGLERTTTDADGSFLLVAQDEDDEIRLHAEKEGYGAGTAEILEPPPASTVEIRLTRGLSLIVRLHGLEPEELEEAVVRIEDSRLGGLGWLGRQAVLDPEGRYRILDLSPGQWTVFAKAAHRSVQESVTLSPDAPEIIHDLVFQPTSEVRGRVTSLGEPLAGADVHFFRRYGHTSVWVKTGEDGTFSAHLEDGDYSVNARLDGYLYHEGRTLTVAGLSVDGVDFQLQREETSTEPEEP